MLLSNDKIAQIVIFISAFSGIFIFNKLPVWIALTALLLPFLILDVLVNRPKINRLFFIFIISLIIVSVLNFQSLKINTIMYSLFLTILFLFSQRKIELCKPELLINIYQNIILIFFTLLIVGLYLHFLLGMNDVPFARVDVSRDFPRSFGPTTEPSYAALILTIAMSVLCFNVGNTHFKIRFLLFLYFIAIIIIGSGIGYLICTVLFIYIFFSSTVKIFNIEKIIILTLSLIGLFFLSNDSIERLKPLFEILFNAFSYNSFEEASNTFKLTDSSAWFRFGPLFEYFKDIELLSLSDILFGHGAGTSTFYFGEKYRMHIDPNWFSDDGIPVMDLPLFPAFIYDYGIIMTLILMYIFKSLIKPIKGNFLFTLIAIFIVFNSNFNTSIFWFFIYSLLVVNVVQNKDKKIEKN